MHNPIDRKLTSHIKKLEEKNDLQAKELQRQGVKLTELQATFQLQHQ